MFKGLRTKIESEQKGKGTPSTPIKTTADTAPSSTKQKGDPAPSQTNHSTNKNSYPVKLDLGSILEEAVSACPPQDILKPESNELNDRKDTVRPSHEGTPSNDTEINKDQVSRLNERIKTLQREKEENSEQTAQLYQIIEKLRRNLEQEKETNSSLQTKLNEAQAEISDAKNVHQPHTFHRASGISSKSFYPDGTVGNVDLQRSSNTDALRQETIELQAQLLKKNRQLKICQQNLIDMKKTLQREILDHSRTQEALQKSLNQIKELINNQNYTSKKDYAPHQNGSSKNSEIGEATNGSSTSLSDKYQEAEPPANLERDKEVVSGQDNSGGPSEDNLSVNTAGLAMQLDRISCLSRSSASVDEFESNDLQGSHIKEVNHEYLKNVLFRYMTSTEMETTQHLVKALSVLMNFTPEQSAAVKSAMRSRSSWLRLK